MKLLGWMQSRLKQSTLSLKDSTFGYSSTCLCLQPQTSDSLANRSHGLWKSERRQPFPITESKKEEKEVSGLFDGFLAIGTLDLNKTISDPSTPTLVVSEQNPAENGKDETGKTGEKEETEERKEEIGSILLGTKLKVVEEEEEEGSDIPGEEKWINLCEMVGEGGGEGRRTSVNEGNRMSLGELLEKTVMEEIKNKSSGKLEVERIKKKAKKRIPHFSVSMKKLLKMMSMLNKKVHLQSLTSKVEVQKENKNHTRTASVTLSCGGSMGSQILPDEDLIMILQKSKIKDVISWQNGYSTLPQLSHKIDPSKGVGEYWIKTDADCEYILLQQHAQKQAE